MSEEDHVVITMVNVLFKISCFVHAKKQTAAVAFGYFIFVSISVFVDTTDTCILRKGVASGILKTSKKIGEDCIRRRMWW